jgi:hypothetical protein
MSENLDKLSATVDTVTPEQELRARVEALEEVVGQLCEILNGAEVAPEEFPLEAGHKSFVQSIRRRRRAS